MTRDAEARFCLLEKRTFRNRCEDNGPRGKQETQGQYTYIGRPVDDMAYMVRPSERGAPSGTRRIDR